MKSFDETSGGLELVVGTCWLSRFELSRLAPGSIILTDRIAGKPFELRFNGERLAEAEAALIQYQDPPTGEDRARMAARIVSLERSDLPEPEPVRGLDLTGLLPAAVVLGASPGVSSSLSSLAGLGRMSLLDLGIEARRDTSSWRCGARLLVAGAEAGRGTIGVRGENMAFILESLSADFSLPFFSRSPVELTGSLAESAEGLKLYDFSKPDCFTRRQIDAAARIHEAFIRTLSLSEPSVPTLRVTLTDQLNFTEYLESLPPGTPVLAAPATGSERPLVPREDRPEKAFFAPRPLPQGYPEAETEAWARASMECPSGGSILLSGPLAERFEGGVLASLRESWRRFGSLSPRPGPRAVRSENIAESVRAFAPWAGEWEMVILVELSSEGGKELTVTYPIRVLQGVLEALDS